MNPISPIKPSNSINPTNSSNPMNPSNRVILLTIDVEDWFQVENLRPCCPVSSWSSYELRVEKNTHRLLDLLDEASDQRSAVSGRPSNVNNKSSESCEFCQEKFRLDEQDEQEVSSAFPDEKQKDPAKTKEGITKSLTGATKAQLNRGTSCCSESTLSQFRPSGAEAPPGRRQETEKRSGRSCKSCLIIFLAVHYS